MKRNPSYWGTPFHFERVVFSCEPNEYTMLQKLLQGELDWATSATKISIRQSRDDPAVTSGESTEDLRLRRLSVHRLQPSPSVLSDRKVRQSLTQALPIEK